jgi:hypothetical protein
VRRRCTAMCFCAITPGKDHAAKKPRVAQVFKDADEMDDHMGGRQKQRREDKVDQTISASTEKPPSIEFDFSCWASGDAKQMFVPVVGECAPVPAGCLKRRIDLLQDSNSCEAAWVDTVDNHERMGHRLNLTK